MAVGSAGPQLGSRDLSGQRRASTGRSRAEWAAPDLNRDLASGVGSAGPRVGVPGLSGQSRT